MYISFIADELYPNERYCSLATLKECLDRCADIRIGALCRFAIKYVWLSDTVWSMIYPQQHFSHNDSLLNGTNKLPETMSIYCPLNSVDIY